MVKVTIAGWEQGLNKVELNHLIRRHAHFSLGEAKRMVDQLLSGELVCFKASDVDEATMFCSSAEAIGAHCSYSVDEISNASRV